MVKNKTSLAIVGFGTFYMFIVVAKFQKPDDEETEILNQEEDFSLPQSYFIKENVD